MTDELRREPWWASGSDPDEGLAVDEDPVERFASARRAAAGDGAGGSRPGTDGWWQDAVGALADAARPHGGGRTAAGSHTAGDVCHVCPVCVALRALDHSRPEVVAHLSEALRHLSLAARAFVEAQVQETGGVDEGLQKVDLEDD